MLTYKSGQGVDAKIGGKSVRNTINNVKTGVNAIKNIKKDGLVAGVKNTINKNKNTTTKQSVSSNVGDAIGNYQLNMGEEGLRDWFGKSNLKMVNLVG